MFSKYSGPLIKSAQEFFNESLRLYKNNRLKLSIVNAYTTVELMIKARMCLIHDALRLESLNEQKKGHTIKWHELVFRLETFDIKLTADEKELMDKVSKWRNEIVHSISAEDSSTFRARLPQLFEFISKFSKREFSQKNQLLTIQEQRHIRSAKKAAIDQQKEARQKAKVEGKVIFLQCPICGLRGTVTARSSDHYDAYCHYCKRNLRWEPCKYCKRKLLTEDIINKEVSHTECDEKQYANFEPDFQPYWK